MATILNDIVLNQDHFSHVMNKGSAPVDFIYNSKHYRVAPQETVLMNDVLYQHACKLYNTEACPLVQLDEQTGSLAYARSKAKHLEDVASAKILDAQKAAAEAEQAKKQLSEARVEQQTYEKGTAPKK